MKIALLFIPFISLSTLANSDTSTETPLAASVELIDFVIAAQPIKRKEPKFPVQAARNGNEGWVKMSFVVDKEGKVVDPVIEDSSGIKSFEKESLRAVKRWRYSPAMRDGEAIEQCQNSVQLDFRLHKSVAGARRKFIGQYKEANGALDSGDIPLAQELVAKMENGKIWNSYEDTWFWVLKAELNKATQDDKAYLRSLRRSVASKQQDKYLGNELYLNLLQQKFVAELKASLFNDALSTFAQISQLPDNQQTVQVLESYAAKAKKIVSQQPFVLVNAEISKAGSWWHRLSRNRFSFTEIQGEVDRVELRCANKREIYTVAEDNIWTIPKSWGRCSMMVVGDPKATFNLLEIKQDA